MEESNSSAAHLPTPPRTQVKHLNPIPLLVSTSLFLLTCLVYPFVLAIFIGSFNDTGDPGATWVITSLLIAGIVVGVAHIVTGLVSVWKYKSINKLCAAVFWVNISLFVSLLLVPLGLISLKLMPASGTGTSDSPLYLVFVLLIILISTVIPSLSVASIVMSVMAIIKRKSITR